MIESSFTRKRVPGVTSRELPSYLRSSRLNPLVKIVAIRELFGSQCISHVATTQAKCCHRFPDRLRMVGVDGCFTQACIVTQQASAAWNIKQA